MSAATELEHVFKDIGVPRLDERFLALKKSLVQEKDKEKVIASYERLLHVLKSEIAHIEKFGPSLVLEIDFKEVQRNVRGRGCVILRNVVSEEQAKCWEASLKDYTCRHPAVGGHPQSSPAAWNLFETPAQVQMRSHLAVMAAMVSVSRLGHAHPPVLIDFDSQVFPLAPHLDSGAIERWEDEINRKDFDAIFQVKWEDWDDWAADFRVNAKTDLYQTGISCSTWRSLQGWLSLSQTGTGEGSLRVLPSLKASVAYIMLRPLFHTGEFDDSLPTFPGATSGNTQFIPMADHHPHLNIERAVVGIPPVRPGDYVFWHCDLVHSVDRMNLGQNASSACYNACNPLKLHNAVTRVYSGGFSKGRRAN
ncbi:uncharacterized protein N7484_000790 [Penicillium longicatenatum]|uniref:uncharacterized protein n=1 Tax=Penicillium longicatenatum TaxID=1561947 RepID=UPI0025481A3D|nr:uncharacterized protein N7484_000790 [Penicillium longicatenatum]KAJ5657141.1 hypothetical protein N7484_000790 [Penicillium longicatenatum]